MIPSEQVITELIRKNELGTDPIREGLWPVFIGRPPTDPDDCIMIQRDEVPTQGRIQRTGETVGPYGIQVRVRHIEYQEAQVKMLEIADLFDATCRDRVTVGYSIYEIQAITQFSRPIFIGPDPNNRSNFVLNCVSTIREIEI